MAFFTTLDVMRQQLRRKLDEPFPSRFSNTTLDSFLQESAEVLLPYLGAVNDALVYTLPADQYSIDLSVADTDDQLVWTKQLTIEPAVRGMSTVVGIYTVDYLKELFPAMGTTEAPKGRPTHACFVGTGTTRYLTVYPTPDQDYNVTFQAITLPNLMAAGQEPDLPADLRHLVVDYAYGICLGRLNQWQASELVKRTVAAQMKDLALIYISQGDDQDKVLDYHEWDYFHA